MRRRPSDHAALRRRRGEPGATDDEDEGSDGEDEEEEEQEEDCYDWEHMGMLALLHYVCFVASPAWCSNLRCRLLLLVLALLAGHRVWLACKEERMFFTRAAECCDVLGVIVSYMLLRDDRVHAVLGPGSSRHLEAHARGYGFYQAWVLRSVRSAIAMALLWAGSVLPRICVGTLGNKTSDYFGSKPMEFTVPSIIFTNFVLASLLLCYVHVCNGLHMMVEQFCIRFVEDCNCKDAVIEWDGLYALIRTYSRTIEHAFFVLMLAVVTVVILKAAEILVGAGALRPVTKWSLVTEFPLITLVLYAFSRAACVTEVCRQATVLINGVVREGVALPDYEILRLVQHMRSSEAGFSIHGERVRSSSVYKLAWFIATVSFTSLAQTGNNDTAPALECVLIAAASR